MYEALPDPVRVVDLFAGCGGLSLGIAEAARRLGRGIDVRLAIDSDTDAANVFRANFPVAVVETGRVEDWFDGALGSSRTRSEKAIARRVGRVDVLVGGPPCQGHSDLNNHTRRDDERNSLYARMARAVETLEPAVVLVENVPSVQHDVKGVVEITAQALRDSVYRVEERVVDLLPLGVPQRRRRHVILAVKDPSIDPAQVLNLLGPGCERHRQRSVRWAIADLVDGAATSSFDTASVPSPENERRMRWLFRGTDRYDLPNDLRPECHQSEHSYVSMYGRLRWEEPAQTVTTGFGSMGQGRYVHPAARRTITPHEAARLQMIPDFMDFRLARTRGALARLIGNAVPPSLSMAVTELVLPLLDVDTAKGEAAHEHERRPRGVPRASTEAVARRMRSTRQRDTAAERRLQQALDQEGLEYELDRAPISSVRTRADVVFADAHVAVYLDGCFWHGCPEHGTWPKANAEWWKEKLEGNRRRDAVASKVLKEAGWLVLRFWAHEPAAAAARTIAREVRSRPASNRTGSTR